MTLNEAMWMLANVCELFEEDGYMISIIDEDGIIHDGDEYTQVVVYEK